MGGLWLLAQLPRAIQSGMGWVVGSVSYRMNSRACLVSRANIKLCLPHLSDASVETLVARSLILTGRTVFETPSVWLKAPEYNDPLIVEVRGESYLTEARSMGQGVLILLPHIGNWEMMNVYFARYPDQVTAMYQPPRQAYLAQDMHDVRERLGNDMVPANVAGVKGLYQRLRHGRTVVVLGDQVPNHGKFAPFFGEMALTDTLVWRMARSTGARLLFMCALRREDGRFDIECRLPEEGVYDADIEVGLAAVNLTVQRCVEDHPEQYQWEYKRFRERPAGERKLYAFRSSTPLYH